MDDFYAARSRTIPPLPWSSFAPPFTLYRDLLTKARVIDKLFHRFDDMLRGQGYLAMGGQLLDATIVQAPRQRITKEEKAEIKAGKAADEIWDKPAKARRKTAMRDGQSSILRPKPLLMAVNHPVMLILPSRALAIRTTSQQIRSMALFASSM